MIGLQTTASRFFALDTTYRGTERRTHLTHWPVAFNRQFFRVRSAYIPAPYAVCVEFPLFFPSADCLHEQVRP